MILKKDLLTELEKKYKKDSQKGNNYLGGGGMACFARVSRSTANQHFFKVGLTGMRK